MKTNNNKISRRELLTSTAMLGGSALLLGRLQNASASLLNSKSKEDISNYSELAPGKPGKDYNPVITQIRQLPFL